MNSAATQRTFNGSFPLSSPSPTHRPCTVWPKEREERERVKERGAKRGREETLGVSHSLECLPCIEATIRLLDWLVCVFVSSGNLNCRAARAGREKRPIVCTIFHHDRGGHNRPKTQEERKRWWRFFFIFLCSLVCHTLSTHFSYHSFALFAGWSFSFSLFYTFFLSLLLFLSRKVFPVDRCKCGPCDSSSLSLFTVSFPLHRTHKLPLEKSPLGNHLPFYTILMLIRAPKVLSSLTKRSKKRLLLVWGTSWPSSHSIDSFASNFSSNVHRVRSWANDAGKLNSLSFPSPGKVSCHWVYLYPPHENVHRVAVIKWKIHLDRFLFARAS